MHLAKYNLRLLRQSHFSNILKPQPKFFALTQHTQRGFFFGGNKNKTPKQREEDIDKKAKEVKQKADHKQEEAGQEIDSDEEFTVKAKDIKKLIR